MFAGLGIGRLFCLAISLCVLVSCERVVRTSDNYTPLPDEFYPDRTDSEMVREAVERLPQYRDTLAAYEQSYERDILMYGQLETAASYAAGMAVGERRPPVVFWSKCAFNADGELVFALDQFNTNRETHKIRIVFRDSMNRFLYLVKEMDIRSKLPGVICPLDLCAQYVDWEKLLGMATQVSKGRFELTVGSDSMMLFPKETTITACVAVEDRNGLLSSFVKVLRSDGSEKPE